MTLQKPQILYYDRDTCGGRNPEGLSSPLFALPLCGFGGTAGTLNRGAGPGVQVLIVEQDADLARIWAGFLTRQGLICTHVASVPEAYEALRRQPFAAIVLDMEFPEGGALEVADFATYRNPEVPIIAVTARGFFSDSAIFELVPNARGLLRSPARLEDMAALVQHYGARRPGQART